MSPYEAINPKGQREFYLAGLFKFYLRFSPFDKRSKVSVTFIIARP